MVRGPRRSENICSATFPADEIEGVGLFTLMENELSSLKANVGGTSDYESEVVLWKIIEKRMLTQNLL